MTVLGKEIHRVYDPDGPIQIFDDGVCRHLSFGTQDEQGCILKAKPSQLQYAYSKAMKKEDTQLMQKIGKDYVDYMEEKLIYFEKQSEKLLVPIIFTPMMF